MFKLILFLWSNARTDTGEMRIQSLDFHTEAAARLAGEAIKKSGDILSRYIVVADPMGPWSGSTRDLT